MEKKQREITLKVSGLRVREAEGGNGEKSREIEGHAVVYGQRSVNLIPWSDTREVYEIMEPGSITPELLKASDVVLTCYHDNSRILGRSTNGVGTLQLTIDEKGLAIRCELPHTATGDEMLELIERGDVSGMSFAYTADEEDSEHGVSYERTAEKGANGREVWVRHVWAVNGLYDVTIAGHPAYQGTDVGKAEREAGDAIEKRIERQLNKHNKMKKNQKKRECTEEELEKRKEELDAKEKELDAREAELDKLAKELDAREKELEGEEPEEPAEDPKDPKEPNENEEPEEPETEDPEEPEGEPEEPKDDDEQRSAKIIKAKRREVAIARTVAALRKAAKF